MRVVGTSMISVDGNAMSRSAQTESTVDAQYLSSHIARIIAGQKSDDAGDFHRLTNPPQRNGLLDAIAGQIADDLTHVGFDHAGRDSIDAHFAAGELFGQATRPTMNPTPA